MSQPLEKFNPALMEDAIILAAIARLRKVVEDLEKRKKRETPLEDSSDKDSKTESDTGQAGAMFE